jgi:hypothetical protein
VVPVQGLELAAGEQPEPKEERHRRVAQVRRKAPGGFQVSLLEHVGRVDTPLKPSVQPELHHAVQPLPVPVKGLAQGLGIPVAGALQEFRSVPGITGHDWPP